MIDERMASLIYINYGTDKFIKIMSLGQKRVAQGKIRSSTENTILTLETEYWQFKS
jgi:hypothetical protein